MKTRNAKRGARFDAPLPRSLSLAVRPYRSVP
jgi:hypothetical protein